MNDGKVYIKLRGQEIALTASAAALRRFTKNYPEIQTLIAKIGMFNVEAMVDVVEAGILPETEDREALFDALYEAGLMNVMPLLTRYVMLVMSGGVEPSKDEKGEETEKKTQ